MQASGPEWRITGIRREPGHGVDCVLADVEGRTLWFESVDTTLDPSPEAFASLLFLPALHHGATVRVDAPLDPVWLAGTARLPAIYAAWWGYPDTHPLRHPGPAPPAPAPEPAAGACFTGGVDSFHTLLTGGDRFERLLFVHGYDIPLADAARMEAFDRTLRDVAERTGKRPLRLRTNLREHPIVASVNWERTHGAALAAAGLVASPAIGTLIVPSSYRRELLRPWGSHPDTDPLWSTGRMRIVHDDHRLGREAKLAAIVNEPLVWRHLRVCWENRTAAANCSACLKCVRTMTAISAHRPLRDFALFDHAVPLASRLDALPSVSEHLVQPWRTLLELDLDPDVRRALVRLLARSEPGMGAARRWIHAARRITARLRGR